MPRKRLFPPHIGKIVARLAPPVRELKNHPFLHRLKQNGCNEGVHGKPLVAQ